MRLLRRMSGSLRPTTTSSASISLSGLTLGLLWWVSVPALALDFPHELALTHSGAGTLTVSAEVGGSRADFLVDTGAGMVTINRELFEALQASGELQSVRRMAVRLANNRLRPVEVYSVQRFRLGEHCELGPLEVAVMGSGSRNLLGLSALGKAAPFALDPRTPSLFLSHCGGEARVAGLP